MMDALGLKRAVDLVAVFPDDIILMDGISAQEITRIPLGENFRARFGQPYALVHRADLHRVLLDACLADDAIDLRPATAMESFEERDGGVTIAVVNGAPIVGRALIGADGLWSKTREAIVGDGAPRVSGHIAYRAVLPIDQVEPRYRHNAMMLWAGPRNHLVQYPLRGGEFFNLVAVFHSDRYVEGWDREGDPEELHRRFADNCDPVRYLLDKVETWRMWVLCDREPARNWGRGRATLVGDAAHPMLQYLAQGAGMALEDAVVLAQSLVASNGNFELAARAYETRRYLRTGRCQLMARIYGGFYHAEGVARELANTFLAGRSVEDSFESLSWLYDFDPKQIFESRSFDATERPPIPA